MKKFIFNLFFILFCVFYFLKKSNAFLLQDYRGTLGNNEIGLTIQKTNDTKIQDVHYFYTKYLQDIPLKLKKQEGRDLVLEELDGKGKLVGLLKLNFPEKDPKNHFSPKANLETEILVGTWESLDGKKSFPIYLMSQDEVNGDETGGRCDLNYQDYQKLQEKIKQFWISAKNGDAKTLQANFNFKMPKSLNWRTEIAKTVPHDLFCNYQGFMLGNGIVWFDENGNVIN